MENNLDCRFEVEEKDKNEQKQKFPILLVIIVICITVAVCVSIFLMVYFLVIKKKEEEKEDNGSENEQKKAYHMYLNIPTAINGKILNTFREGQTNYNATLGSQNGGNDYEPNDRNNFDLCIPEYNWNRKDKYNKVLILIHGGGWEALQKENISIVCPNNEKYGFIVVAIGYTLLNGTYNQSNIYRIMDDINAAVYGTKELLVSLGYQANKLELALQGFSAGAHLCLLYANLVKDHPIPIRAIFDIVGPISVSPYDYWLPINLSEPLYSIEPESFELAVENNKAIYHKLDHKGIIGMINILLGNKFNESIEEMYDYNKKEIILESPKFKELLEKVQNAFPNNHITENSPPVLCIYGGADPGVGIAQYKTLKNAYRKHNIEDKINLVYLRPCGHDSCSETDLRYCEMKLTEFSYWEEKMLEKYFHNDE